MSFVQLRIVFWKVAASLLEGSKDSKGSIQLRAWVGRERMEIHIVNCCSNHTQEQLQK